MEKFACKIEGMCREKLSFYKELKTVVEQEKKYIVDMDVDSLWKMADRKKQLAAKIEQIRDSMVMLLEDKNIPLKKEATVFSLSHVINCLPLSSKLKINLKKLENESDMVKKELASMASENKRYVNEYLSVINGIFTTITGSGNKEQYNNSGRVLNNKTGKYLIRAEV
ncbi:flagellar export chaperone FlgN [Desulfobacula toluolica]|uniref:Uncharacterized flagellar apparatus related protein, related to FlgN n=1 Tax=Desulfobacula toluolica (strain DSM 7467 / Tol2) TaxID=651182 RepID=K0NLV6_DESTT|nr:flagellar export chaperone FlgN [Desulfobacula toluolica]CCK81710.1 uncharacterized flagellar apparatus related protein, related to FlgN [Desulfobacula toluolica Tol2]